MNHSEGKSTAADIDLVERCLEGDAAATLEFKQQHALYLQNVLFSYRATEDEVEEVLAQLWMDCLTGPPPKAPLLLRYNGKSALKSWLGAVIINRWLSLKRRHVIHAKAIDQLSATVETDDGSSESLLNIEILEIMTSALKKSFADCQDEDVILLQLVHVHHLTQREAAALWNTHESQISRRLRAAEATLAESTLKAIKTQDPHLDITWKDFVRLCESTNLLLS